MLRQSGLPGTILGQTSSPSQYQEEARMRRARTTWPMYSELRRSERDVSHRIAHVLRLYFRRDTYCASIAVCFGWMHSTIHPRYMYRGKTVPPPRENCPPPVVKATATGGGARNASAVDGSRAFGYVPLARVRRWTFLVTNSDDGSPRSEGAAQRIFTPTAIM